MRVHARAGSKKDEGVVDLCADYALDNWPSTGGVGGQLSRIIHNAPIGFSAAVQGAAEGRFVFLRPVDFRAGQPT
jgi:hypothetical protein